MRLSQEGRELLNLQHAKSVDEVFRRRRNELYKLQPEAQRSGPARAAIDRLYAEMISEIVEARAEAFLTAFEREEMIPSDEEIQAVAADLTDVAHKVWYGEDHHPFPSSQNDFQSIVPRVRLGLLVKVKAMRRDAQRRDDVQARATREAEVAAPTSARAPYVAATRMQELRELRPTGFDLSRLIALCEELNAVSVVGAHHATAMLMRAVMDHVPPLFGVSSFAQVASNYGGSKSFKEAMHVLESAARKIGDAHLHTQIRARESLPAETQVNFAPQLDFLLAEVVRLLK
jgi:hypothetical protein